MSYRKKKEQPEVIDKKVILCLSKKHETLDRNNIAERIGNPYQTVKNGLNRLKEQGILEESDVKKEIGRGKGKIQGFTQGYKLRKSIDVFIKIFSNNFNDSEFREFHRSAYCQGMINQELAKYLIEKWNCPENVELFDKVKKETVKLYELSERNPKITLPKLLQMSPTALKIAFLDEPHKSITDWQFFKAAILAAIILDGYHLVEVPGSVYGWVNSEIKVKIGIDDDGNYMEENESIKMGWGEMEKVPEFEIPDYFEVSTEEGRLKEGEWREKWGFG